MARNITDDAQRIACYKASMEKMIELTPDGPMTLSEALKLAAVVRLKPGRYPLAGPRRPDR